MPILPNGCLLPREEREVVYATLSTDEVPCLGCPRRRGCPASVADEFRVARSLAPPGTIRTGAGRSCPRCGSDVFEWRIEGNRRGFTCTGAISDHTRTPGGIPCGWTNSESSASISH